MYIGIPFCFSYHWSPYCGLCCPQKIARIASARLNNLLRGSVLFHVCNMPVRVPSVGACCSWCCKNETGIGIYLSVDTTVVNGRVNPDVITLSAPAPRMAERSLSLWRMHWFLVPQPHALRLGSHPPTRLFSVACTYATALALYLPKPATPAG